MCGVERRRVKRHRTNCIARYQVRAAHNLGAAQMHPCVERRFLAALVQPCIDTAGNRVSGGVVRVAYRNPDREFM